jgi:hypothetical protein
MILHLAIIGGKVKIRSAIFLNGQYVNAANRFLLQYSAHLRWQIHYCGHIYELHSSNNSDYQTKQILTGER